MATGPAERDEVVPVATLMIGQAAETELRLRQLEATRLQLKGQEARLRGQVEEYERRLREKEAAERDTLEELRLRHGEPDADLDWLRTFAGFPSGLAAAMYELAGLRIRLAKVRWHLDQVKRTAKAIRQDWADDLEVVAAVRRIHRGDLEKQVDELARYLRAKGEAILPEVVRRAQQGIERERQARANAARCHTEIAFAALWATQIGLVGTRHGKVAAEVVKALLREQGVEGAN